MIASLVAVAITVGTDRAASERQLRALPGFHGATIARPMTIRLRGRFVECGYATRRDLPPAARQRFVATPKAAIVDEVGISPELFESLWRLCLLR